MRTMGVHAYMMDIQGAWEVEDDGTDKEEQMGTSITINGAIIIL